MGLPKIKPNDGTLNHMTSIAKQCKANEAIVQKCGNGHERGNGTVMW